MVSLVDNFLPQSGVANPSASIAGSGGPNPTSVSNALNAVEQTATPDGHIALSARAGDTFQAALGLHNQSTTGSNITGQSSIRSPSFQADSDAFNNIVNLSVTDAVSVENDVNHLNFGSDRDILTGFIDPNSYLATANLANSDIPTLDFGQNIYGQQRVKSDLFIHSALLTAQVPDSSILIEPLAQLAGGFPAQSHLIPPHALTALSDGVSFGPSALVSGGPTAPVLENFDHGNLKGDINEPLPALANTLTDHSNKPQTPAFVDTSGDPSVSALGDISANILKGSDPLSAGLVKTVAGVPSDLDAQDTPPIASNAASVGRTITSETDPKADSLSEMVKADHSQNEIASEKASSEQSLSQKNGQNSEAQNDPTGNTGITSPPAEGHGVGAYSAESKQKSTPSHSGQTQPNQLHLQEPHQPLTQLAKDPRAIDQGKDHSDARPAKEVKAPSLASLPEFHQLDESYSSAPEEVAYSVRELNTIVLRSRAENQPLATPSLSPPSASLESLTGFTALDGLDPLGDALFTLPTDMIEASRINLNSPAAIAAGHQAAKGLALAIHKNTSAGQDHFSIRLDPPSLGRVTVQLKFSEGQVTADILAERPETLTLLKRDSKILEKALAETGYDLSAEDISFALDDQESPNSHSQSAGKSFTEEALNGQKNVKNNDVTDMDFKNNHEASSENSVSDTLTDPLTLEALIGGRSPLLGLDIRV